MSYSIKLIPAAKVDIKEAKDWCEGQKIGTGDQFALQLFETIDYVTSNPKLFCEYGEEIRQATVAKFPFNLFYLIDEEKEQIIILALLHASENPKIWERKKRDL